LASLEVDLHNVSTLNEYKALFNTQRLDFRVPLLWDVKTLHTWASCA